MPSEFKTRNSNTNIEKNQELEFINQDALITQKLNLNNLINDLESRLNVNPTNETIEQIKNDYPQIVKITRSQNVNIRKYQVNKIDDNHVNIAIPTKKELYHLTINLDYYTNIKDKEELRMFTVTYIQNNRWKTTPTKYKPKKNLSLNLDNNLPDLNPNFDEKGISHYIQNEILIKFKGKIPEQELEQLVKRYDLIINKKNTNTVVAHSEKYSTKDLIKLFEQNELDNNFIDYIEPHFIYLSNNTKPNNFYQFIPNDVLYNEYQWNLPMIYTIEGWQKTKGNEDVIVAVIDTGVDLTHPEFEGRLVEGINIIEPGRQPIDDDGHGTHVAGVISANTNNQEGIAGLTWYTKIMPIKVLDQSGAGTLFDVAEGIIWATNNGAKVINMSLGNYAESQYLHDAVKYAYEKDVIMVAATGNDDTDELGYPAAYPEVLGVSAVDEHSNRAEFSNYGEYVDVVAPGVSIPSTYPDNQYAALSGTSMASPHVAGLAALIRSFNSNLSNEDIYDIIKHSSTDLGKKGKDDYYGYGQINVEKAISYSKPKDLGDSILLSWIKNLINIGK